MLSRRKQARASARSLNLLIHARASIGRTERIVVEEARPEGPRDDGGEDAFLKRLLRERGVESAGGRADSRKRAISKGNARRPRIPSLSRAHNLASGNRSGRPRFSRISRISGNPPTSSKSTYARRSGGGESDAETRRRVPLPRPASSRLNLATARGETDSVADVGEKMTRGDSPDTSSSSPSSSSSSIFEREEVIKL